VTAYPVLRPDGQWSLMVINRDYDSAHDVRILFRDGAARTESELAGPLEIVTFGKAQYQWHPARLCRSGRSATVSEPQRGSWSDVHVTARIVEYHLWSGWRINRVPKSTRLIDLAGWLEVPVQTEMGSEKGKSKIIVCKLL